jgi:hypothetical protein
MLALEQSMHLGPATVVKVDGDRCHVDVGEHYRWAQLALAFPYQPAANDIVLVAGQEERWYVIGVLKGSGLTQLTVPGDLCIRAPHGSIELNAARGIRLKSSLVKIMAEQFETIARSAFENFTEVTRWVKETFQLRTGRMRSRVDGEFDLKAGSIQQRAREDVKIDGKKIHLG